MATDILKCDIETAIVAMAMVEQIRKSARVPRLFGDESVQDLVSGFGFCYPNVRAYPDKTTHRLPFENFLE